MIKRHDRPVRCKPKLLIHGDSVPGWLKHCRSHMQGRQGLGVVQGTYGGLGSGGGQKTKKSKKISTRKVSLI